MMVMESGRLTVRLQDSDAGPEPARFYLTDSRGRLVVPVGAAHYSMSPEHHFVIGHDFSIELPAGYYSIRVERGPEFQPWESWVNLVAGGTETITPAPTRWIDMNSLGWYSGDVHNHRPAHEMPELMRAEGLNMSTAIADWFFDDAVLDQIPTDGPSLRRAGPSTYFRVFDKEIERLWDGLGAVCLLNLERPLPFKGYRLHPTVEQVCRLARQEGGHVDAEKPFWRDMPALAALGLLDTIGVVHNLFTPHGVELARTQPDESAHWGMYTVGRPSLADPFGMALWGMQIYYRLLNCGFRLGISAGSASGVRPSPPGFSRVYVHLGKRFRAREWWRQLRIGRSFATNGPMIFLDVSGRAPGAHIALHRGARVHVTARAVSSRPLERIDIVVGGEVVASGIPAEGEPTTECHVDVDHEVSNSGWMVARCFERYQGGPRFAHTSPVYLDVAGEPARNRNDAAFFERWMRDQAAFYRGHPGFRTRAHRKSVIDMFEIARSHYRAIARP